MGRRRNVVSFNCLLCGRVNYLCHRICLFNSRILMSSPPHHVYSSFDKRWMQVVSKDDIIQILVDEPEICENKK